MSTAPRPPRTQFGGGHTQVPAGPTNGHKVSAHGSTNIPHATPSMQGGASVPSGGLKGVSTAAAKGAAILTRKGY